MLKKFLFLLIICCSYYTKNFSYAFAFSTSVPKTGTWLIAKYLELLLKKNPVLGNLANLAEGILPPIGQSEFLLNHIPFNQKTKQALSNGRGIIMMRDPRDTLISYYRYALIQKLPEASMSFNDFFYFFLRANPFKEFLPWEEEPNVLLVKFEDLIGPQGGGTLYAQLAIMQKIAYHFNIHITRAQLLEVCKNIYGNSPNFRIGKINQWKTVFTNEQKMNAREAFKDLLTHFNYEL